MTRRVQRCAAKVVLVATALTLGACSQYGVANRAISVNKGLESANNRMLLLNAVRASKRYPRVYSEVTQINTSDPVSGSLGLQVPFGGDAKSNFVLNPQLTLGSGTTLQISPLDKQEFTRGITTPTDLETLNYYLRQGWPKEMLFHMFIRTMRIDNACDKTNFNLSFVESEKPTDESEKSIVCKTGDQTKEARVRINDPSKKPEDQKRFREFRNELRDMISHGLEVRARKFTKVPDWRETTVVETVEWKQEGETMSDGTKFVTTREKDKPTKSSELFLGFKLPSNQDNAPFKCLPDLDDPDSCYIEITVDPLRSPEAMIFYMGELIETQINSKPNFIPSVKRRLPSKDEEDKEEVPLLLVTTGRPSGGASVKVSHEGQTYAIPRANAGRSMSVMSLVSLIFGAQREADELPTTPTVISIGQ